jgi:hypothetical protein
MTKEVNPDLYEFLRNNETGMYQQNGRIVFYVHVDFCDVSDFVEIIGPSYLEEGGMEVQLMTNTIAVELNDIIEGEDHYFSSYKKCFPEHDWKSYEHVIAEMEA